MHKVDFEKVASQITPHRVCTAAQLVAGTIVGSWIVAYAYGAFAMASRQVTAYKQLMVSNPSGRGITIPFHRIIGDQYSEGRKALSTPFYQLADKLDVIPFGHSALNHVGDYLGSAAFHASRHVAPVVTFALEKGYPLLQHCGL